MNEILTAVNRLIHDDVIENTYRVMLTLRYELQLIKVNNLTPEQKAKLSEALLELRSESIREALHKHELHITNSIIKVKNQVLKELGVQFDAESHSEIDPAKYNWNW